MNDRKYDVIVIGGGIAGTACAKFAAEKGLSVLLFERKSSCGTKVCSEGSPCSIKGVMDLAPFVVNEVRGARIYMDYRLVADPQFARTIGLIINRQELATWLADEAVRHGAVVKQNSSVVSVDRHTTLTRTGEVFRGRYTVFADGTNTLARRFFDYSAYESYVALQYLMRRCQIRNPEIISLFTYSREVAFGWIFPLDRRCAHVGVSAPAGASAKRLLRQLVASARLGSPVIETLRGARVPTGGMVPRIVDHPNGYVVCGDAAGQYLPLIGEGNRIALAAANFAANAMAQDNLNLYPKAFSPYKKMIDSHLEFTKHLREASFDLRARLVQDFCRVIFRTWLTTHAY